MIPRSRRRAGYSLLEILIALSIMALAAMMIMPDLSATLGAASRRTAAVELDQQLLSLRRSVRAEGVARAIGVLDGRESRDAEQVEAAQLRLPSGWSYEADPAIVFHTDGRCDGGVIVLIKQGAPAARFAVEPPRCRAVLL